MQVITTVARELARCKLDVEGVQEVRWDKEGTIRAGDYNFFYGRENENHQLGTEFFVHHRKCQQLRKQNLLVIGCHIGLKF
jgi:hypothetical protein